MIYPSIDKLLNNVGSKFLLVNIVSQRVKEMQETDYYQLNEASRAIYDVLIKEADHNKLYSYFPFQLRSW